MINPINNSDISFKKDPWYTNAITRTTRLDAFGPIIALETIVDTGRAVNAYKRGGKNEFRERFIDDVVSAVFWMKGVDIFNHAGNGWIKIEGKFKKVCCGEFSVLAINDYNEVFYRKGVTLSCFEGESWEKLGISFKHISEGFDGIWGIDENDNIYYKI